MADSNSDPVAQAADRLEVAIDRLATALAASLAATGPGGAPGIPRAEVMALAEKLETTIARLRGTLREAAPDDEEDEEG